MASGKKGAKGNKTAHVLNLLTAPGEAPPAAESGAPAPEEAQPASSRPLLPPILEVAQANDDSLAQQIQQALEDELAPPAPEPAPVEEMTPVIEDKPVSGGKMSQEEIEKMLASMAAPAQEPAPPPPEPAPAPGPAAPSGGKMSQEEIEKMLASMTAPAQEPAPPPPPPEPAPAPEPAASSGGKMSQEEIEKMLASMTASAQEPAPPPPPEPAPAPEPAPPPKAVEKPAPPPEEDISYVNVMQVLVEEKAPRYIKKFGLCSCKHCEADVKALTLTNLVPKYVVLSKLDRIPMLTVYEGRYNTTIFAQLTRACKVVMDNPHHDRPE